MEYIINDYYIPIINIIFFNVPNFINPKNNIYNIEFITVIKLLLDGFYTNFELLDGSIANATNITEDTYLATSYTDYITPTPEDDIYYMWYAGPEEEVYPFNLTLTASKFSTLGTE